MSVISRIGSNGSRLLGLAALALAAIIPACGASSPEGSLPTHACIEFTAEADPTTRSVVLRRGADSLCCCAADC